MIWAGVAQAQGFRLDEWTRTMVAARAAMDGGQYKDADRLYSSAVHQAEDAGARKAFLARALYELASLREVEGRNTDASRLLKRAIDMAEADSQLKPAELAIIWQGLGTAYIGMRSYPNAVQAFQKALELVQSKGGAAAADLLPIFGGLSGAYRAQHKYREAETAIMHGMEAVDRLPPEDAWTRWYLLTSMGNLYLWEHRLTDAETVLLEAQSIMERSKPPQGSALQDAAARGYLAFNLALVLAGQKKFHEAEPLFVKALRIAESGAPIPPEDAARMITEYARCLRKSGNSDYAGTLEAKAKAMLATAPRDTSAFVVDVGALRQSK
jgi:tetratricopeptide (TPR) repeat protein